MVKKRSSKRAIRKLARRGVPVGVKVIAIFDYIIAALSALFAIILLLAAGGIFTNRERIINELNIAVGNIDLAAGAMTGVIFLIAIFMLAIAVFVFFVARGLWKGRNWARITEIIIVAIGFINALMALFQGDYNSILGLAINGLIGGYLLFNSDAKRAFS